MSIELVKPFNHLILCYPLLLLPSILPNMRVFCNESALHIRGSKYWSFSILLMNIQGSFPLELTGLIFLLSKRLSRVFSSTTVQKCQFFSTWLSLWSSSHICTWLLEKTIALTIQIFVGKVMSLLFNLLSRFVIAFLSRNKHLLISWLQSLSVSPSFNTRGNF